ncbi:MAG: LysR family transcriptional regulator [Deltaproteobacteria bacterium]|nr:LysR family transcriptional regulator [Deltaproteobacteria bacterium]
MFFKQLEAFHAVVKYGGFERASASIHVTQPAISTRVKELEKQFGAKLFMRLGRRAHLTDAGRIVEEYATRLMIVINEMNQAVDELKGLQRGYLRCGSGTTIAVHVLPKILVQFKKHFPNIEVALLVGNNAETEKRILSDESDIAIVTRITNPESLRIFHFLSDEFVLITPRDHPLTKLRRVSLKQVAKTPLILREAGSYTRTIIDEGFRAAGISYRCIMEFETTEILKSAVAEGLGCSLVSLSSVQKEKRMGLLTYARISGVPMKREFKAIMHKDKSLSGPLKPFLELLKIKVNSPPAERKK